ncbi:MAG: acetoacetate--CoA ligase [Ignavibacteriae bacterium HGW-Ignavibacteriae-3]|nr:MAG: acetoacetate--CoA ligase [Ignavibacteriae bacterium HGW-Ignavibacteriae-3]
MNKILWQPSDDRIESANIFIFMKKIEAKFNLKFAGYKVFHKWTADYPEDFWEEFLFYSKIKYSGNYKEVLNGNKMPGAKWFDGIKLNYAENILESGFEGTALKYFAEKNGAVNLIDEYSFSYLRAKVFPAASALRKMGVQKGSRVAGIVTNSPEAVIAALACAAIGAVWSSASPDFGGEALIERFSQIEPEILFASSFYKYNGKNFDTSETVKKLLAGLPSVPALISLPFCGEYGEDPGGVRWEDFLLTGVNEKINYERVEFDHPLFIMFSSGTTGTPKCIVHGTGGTLIQHRKEHLLHCDFNEKDSLLYFTTASWMMWNWQLSALAGGVEIILYDDAPNYPDHFSIWNIVDQHKITHFGTSGKYIESCMKYSPQPEKYSSGKFDDLKSLMYTGSPLSAAGYEWIYDSIKKDVRLSGISGGTDILSCFVLGNPMLPVKAGKIQCKGLGVDVSAFNEEGNEIFNKPGELVCRKPIPSMPIGFLNDPDNQKFTASYFSGFKDVWTHGDYIEFDDDGHSIIHGRSDATLNPGGVRIGVAEIYSALDHIEFVKGAIAAGWVPPNQSDEVIVLLVVLEEGMKLNDEIAAEIKSIIKKKNTPRHVPKYIFQISSVPVTRSGKPVELTVKAILGGKEIKNLGSIANAGVLDEIKLIRDKLSLMNKHLF